MQALFAGTSWLQMKVGFIVATNVYHVLVPGRFQIHWASLNSKFETVGRLRTCQYMHAAHPDIKSIQADTLWPEAWKVTLTINPISMFNYNVHNDYLVYGFGQQRIAKTRVGDDSKLGKMLNGSYISNMGASLFGDALDAKPAKLGTYKVGQFKSYTKGSDERKEFDELFAAAMNGKATKEQEQRLREIAQQHAAQKRQVADNIRMVAAEQKRAFAAANPGATEAQLEQYNRQIDQQAAQHIKQLDQSQKDADSAAGISARMSRRAAEALRFNQNNKK